MKVRLQCLLLLLIPTLIFAQQPFDSSKLVVLDAVSVTASVAPQKTSVTGRNIIIIKGEEIARLPVHSIDELLRYIPGVEVQARGPMGSQSDIVLRGGTFQQVLIILDGIRVNDPNTGHFNSYIPISPAEIDRIEILKGASSAIYGSEAVGGVIQVITKSFAAKQNIKSKQVGVVLSAGEYELMHANAGGSYGNGKTFVSGGALINHTNGQPQRGTRGFFDNNTFSISGSHFFTDNLKLSLRTSYDRRKFSAQNFYTTFASDTAKEEVKTFWNQAKLEYTKSKSRVSVDLGYKSLDDEYAFSPRLAPNKNKSKLFQLLSMYEYKATGTATIITGAQFQNRQIQSNDRGDHNVSQAALFVMLNKNFGGRFFLSPAIRVDWDERGGTEFVPQVNLSYRVNKLQLRGSAGKTIRQADFTERFNNYNKPLVTSGSIGNPDLQAERSFSYEAGGDYFANNNLKLSATFFQRYHKNLIDWTNTPYADMPRKDNLSPAGTYALAKNIAKVTTTGFETDVQYIRYLSRSGIIIGSIGAVWLETKSSDIIPSFYISSHARWLLNFNLRYANRFGALSFTGLYKNRKTQAAPAIQAKVNPDCFIINTRAEVFVIKHRLLLFVEVDNISDNNSQDLLGSQLPGRWFSGGLRFAL